MNRSRFAVAGAMLATFCLSGAVTAEPAAPATPSAAATKVDKAVTDFLTQARRSAARIPQNADVAKELTAMQERAAQADAAYLELANAWRASQARIEALTKDLYEQDPADATKTRLKAPPQRINFPDNAKYMEEKRKYDQGLAELTRLRGSADADLRKVNEAQTKLDEANAAMVEAQRKSDESAKIDADLPALKAQLDTLKITDLVEDLKLDGLDMQQRLGAIVAKLDNALLGRYMQEKLERLVGSKEFCEAAAACGQTPGGTPKKLDSMFDGKTHAK